MKFGANLLTVADPMDPTQLIDTKVDQCTEAVAF